MTTKDDGAFNLIDEAWIPCLFPDGTMRYVGIREVLLNAGAYSELRDPSPLVTAALHRLLLAILHRALEGPRDLCSWTNIWKAGCFPSESVTNYLAKWLMRFALFDADHPFYQVGKAKGKEFEVCKRSKGKPTGEHDRHPVSELAQELTKGNNATLFDHTSSDASPFLSPAECARFLLANQMFSVDGNPNPPLSSLGQHPAQSAAPLAGGAAVLLKGNTLFETLMLNLLVYSKNSPFPPTNDLKDDCPPWEEGSPPAIAKTRTCVGYIDLLTWQSRCVRLLREPDGLVRWMFYAPAAVPDQSSCPNDPMWFMRYNTESETESAIRLDPHRALWRSSDSLFAFSVHADKGRETRPRAFSQILQLQEMDGVFGGKERWQCSLYGIYKEYGGPVRLWAHEELPVPLRLLKDEQAVNALAHGLRFSEGAADALDRALVSMADSFGYDRKRRDPRRPSDAKRKAEGLQGLPRYWSELEIPFKAFLGALGEDSNSDDPLKQWMGIVRRVVRDAFAHAAENSLGRSARELKARVDADRCLNAQLKGMGLGAEAVKQEVSHG